MAGRSLEFRFTSTLVRLERGYAFHVLPVPERIALRWKRAKISRIVGTINGTPVKRALMSHRDGGSFLFVSRDLMRRARIGFITPAQLTLRPDPRPTAVEVPRELAIALRQDSEAKSRWDSFTAGRRRSLALYVTSAKTEATRIRRAVELAKRVRMFQLYGDLQRSRPIT